MPERLLKWATRAVGGVFCLVMALESLGISVPAQWLPGQIPLVPVLATVLLSLLVWRSERSYAEVYSLLRSLEDASSRTAEALGRLDAAEKKVDEMVNRLSTVQAGAQETHRQLWELRNTIAQKEILLPAKIALLQGRVEEAAALLEEVIERSPDNREARWLLGQALFSARRPFHALEHLRAGLDKNDAEQLFLLARCEYEVGRYHDAFDHATEAISRGVRNEEEAVALRIRALAKVNLQDALREARAAVDQKPYASPIRYALIDLLVETHDYDSAVNVASSGYMINDRDAGCLVRKAEALLRRGRPEDEAEAQAALDMALNINPRDFNIYRLKGELLHRQAGRAATDRDRRTMLELELQNYSEAIPRLNRGPLRAAMLNSKSRVLLLLDKFDEAERAAEHAVSQGPQHISNYIALALARLAGGRWLAAVLTAQEAQQKSLGGWAGQVQIKAAYIIGCAMGGANAHELARPCKQLADLLETPGFRPSEAWLKVGDVLTTRYLQRLDPAMQSQAILVNQTLRLLKGEITPAEYREQFGQTAS